MQWFDLIFFFRHLRSTATVQHIASDRGDRVSVTFAERLNYYPFTSTNTQGEMKRKVLPALSEVWLLALKTFYLSSLSAATDCGKQTGQVTSLTSSSSHSELFDGGNHFFLMMNFMTLKMST